MPNPHPNSLRQRVAAYATHPLWLPRRVAWEILRRTRQSVVVNTPQGSFRIRTANRVIGTQLYTRREYEQSIMRFAIGALAEEGLSLERRAVIDIGANIGMSSIALITGRYCQRTLAVEPEPTNFADLVENVTRNGLSDRIACYRFAASDVDGSVTMELADVNFGDHRVRIGANTGGVYGEATRPTVPVRSRTIDGFVAPLPPTVRSEIGALWIDVQGHDAHVLRGARRLIANGVPVITEFWPYGQRRAGVSADAYLALLCELFAHCYIVHDDGRSGPHPLRAITDAYREIGDGIHDLTLALIPHRSDGLR